MGGVNNALRAGSATPGRTALRAPAAVVNEIFGNRAVGAVSGKALGGWQQAMRKALILAAAVLVAGLGVAPACAGNKDGFDAWYRGDYARAVVEWRPAASAGDADAQYNLGQAYTLGRGVPVDLAVAQGWFRKAAMQGHVAAQAKYGLVLFDQGKRSEAAAWLDKATGWGEPRAQLVLGTMLFNGDGVAKDWPRAYALIVRAAAAGAPHASEVQAQMDRYIPTEQRQQGLTLARQYEAEAKRPQLPPEIAGTGNAAAIRGTDLPPSRYGSRAGNAVVIPLDPVTGRAKPGTYAPPGATIPPPIEPSRPAASQGGWRVQLGAFGDAANARRLWSQVGGRFPGREPTYLKSGALTRVLVGGYASRAAALRACGSLRPCVAVAP